MDLGLHLAIPDYRTIVYVEKERFCQDILIARMADGLLDPAPIWDDVRTFNGRQWAGLTDIIHAGYPCQPFSSAGKRLGIKDLRFIWPQIRSIVAATSPEWVFFENVARHLRLGFDVVAKDLVAMGYRIVVGIFSAAEVGAPHLRKRLFILGRMANATGEQSGKLVKRLDAGLPSQAVANADCVRGDGRTETRKKESIRDFRPSEALGDADGDGLDESPIHVFWRGSRQPCDCSSRPGEVMGDAAGKGLEGRGESGQVNTDEWPAWPPVYSDGAAWSRIVEKRPDLAPAIEPEIYRMADGAANRVDRIKALGNAVVPDVAALAFATLIAKLGNDPEES
jgi:DNA (cytosine-5)-methyltransferase 1